MATEQTIPLERYTADAKNLVSGAQALADERKHVQVEPIHLLARALERDRGVGEVFRAAGAVPSEVQIETETQLARLPKAPGQLSYLSGAMLDLLRRAEKEAGSAHVSVEHLLNALSQEIRGAAAAVLQVFSLGPGSLRPHMGKLGAFPRDIGANQQTNGEERFTRDLTALAREGRTDPVIGRDAEQRQVLQILERRQKNHPLLVGDVGVGKTSVVRALAMRVATGDVPHGMSKLQILELDVGALGAGAKLRSEVEDRFRRVVEKVKAGDAILYIASIDSLVAQGNSGNALGDFLKSVLSRGEIRLLADTTPEGRKRLEERDSGLLSRFTPVPIEQPTVEQAIETLRGIATRYEEHHRVRIGDPAIVASVRLAKRYVRDRCLPSSAVDLLDEACARKKVELDGIPADMDRAIRRLASVKAQLSALLDDQDDLSKKTKGLLEQEIEKLEPDVVQMRSTLDSRRGAIAAFEAIRAEHKELETKLEAARGNKDFAKLGELEHVKLPEVKKRLMAAEAAVAGHEGAKSARDVVEQDIAIVLGDWTGIPVAKMLEAESDKLLKMENRLTERVVGQGEAVRAVARAVRRGRVGLRDPGKPIGSFLFLGPSGVGKTELAKALAEFLFDDDQALTRLDMSEFMEKHMAQRLVGAPPGYVDSEEGGFLTEAVRRKPYSVLLFDEVEKAHTDVFNLLLQVLDDGRLTDGRGRTADFSNTVVIMTSNIGSSRILETDSKLFESEEGRDALRDVLMTELRNFLRPEFLNRIDDIVVFRPLSKVDLRGIVDIQLKRVSKLLEDRNIRLELTESAKSQLVEHGYEPAFGARPLKRAILKGLQDPLAEEILAGAYTPGSTIQVDVALDKFTFKKS